jgi:hypothetical protein
MAFFPQSAALGSYATTAVTEAGLPGRQRLVANGKTLYVLDAFLIESGEIIEQQNHYDSRAATG